MAEKEFKNYRKESLMDWGKNVATGSTITRTEIQLGAFLRIADATEAMAKNFNDLIRENKQLRESRDHWQERAKKSELSVPGIRGLVTRYKNKYEALKNKQI